MPMRGKSDHFHVSKPYLITIIDGLLPLLLLLLLLLSRLAGDLGRIVVGETGTDGRTVVHCEILDGMSEWVGRVRGWMGRFGGGDCWL